MRRARPVLLLPALVLALSACGDGNKQANDNGPQEQPERPAEVYRTPELVESPPLTVDQPAGPQASPS